MKTNIAKSVILGVVASLALAGCGGGGSTATPTASGTTTASGTVAKVTSGGVTVQGVDYTTSGATVTVNGEPATTADLKEGMTVKVTGSVEGSVGKANRIETEGEVEGTVSAIDATAGTFIVMGQTVRVSTQTRYDGISALASLQVGSEVEVDGTTNSAGYIEATRVEVKQGHAVKAKFISGTITSLDTAAQTFVIRNVTVSYAGATLPAESLANGQSVLVRGALKNGIFVATKIVASGSVAPTPTPTPTPTPLDGAALYAANCAGCHGALASSAKKGRSAAQIQSAITANSGGMGSITLTSAELQAIATALGGATVTPTPVTDGAALYAANCAGCHGVLAASSKKGTTAAKIQAAIAANRGGMGSITLTTVQVQAIADALAGTTTTTPVATPVTISTTTFAAATVGTAYSQGVAASGGTSPYTWTIASGALPAGLTLAGGVIAGTPTAAGSYTVTLKVTDSANPAASASKSFTLVVAAAATPALDGAALYAANCAGCHGPLATSSKRGATAARIQSGITTNKGGMGSLTLSTAEITAIATALK